LGYNFGEQQPNPTGFSGPDGPSGPSGPTGPSGLSDVSNLFTTYTESKKATTFDFLDFIAESFRSYGILRRDTSNLSGTFTPKGRISFKER
jgi:hypothetical protein